MKFREEEYREQIRKESSGTKVWSMGQSRRYKIVENWEEIKVDVMYEANKAKFSQNAKLKEVLLSTKGDIDARGFPFWAYWNGRILERIREELRAKEERDEKALKLLLDAFEDYRFSRKDPKGWAMKQKKTAEAKSKPEQEK
eukprot:CAMPEP_0170168974 /NCGR_PEP_ID=MMETSP0040_2-20121228/1916_1 /TAXON_ID=641309 /ORGANISM="Lotharella oceanica, Strain CCMP622" /LENGTH=141 /DNA_ID=CAMNT_0010407443 /DNA_START=181 /DNA_END=606 /DNA_ORIENTATION=+